MEILAVKIQGAGYLVNDKTYAPPGSDLYQEVQIWVVLGNTPDPEFTQAELDAQAAQAIIDAENALEAAAVKADAVLKAFIDLKPSGIDAYLDSNVTDLASAKSVLKKLSKIVWLVAKDQF